MPNPRPDDIQNFSAKIVSFDGREFDITDLIHSLEVYQSIMAPTMTCKMYIHDRTGFMGSMPLVGEESIKIEVTSAADPENKISMIFFLHRNDEGQYQDDLKGLTYDIYGVSQEALVDHFKPLSRGYRGQISSMVADLYTNVLKTKKAIFVEPTSGIHEFAIPKRTVFQTLSMLQKYAVSGIGSASAFFSYENFEGFHFRSAEGMVSSNRAATPRYKLQHMALVDPTQIDTSDNVVYMRLAKKYDTLDLMKAGHFYSNAVSFNILEKEGEDKPYVMAEVFEKWKRMEEVKLHTDGFIQQYGNDSAKRFMFPFDSSKGAPNFAESVGAKMSYVSGMMQNQYEAVVPGNMALQAGGVVYITVPELAVPEAVSADDKRMPQTSGLFLIVDVEHIVQKKTKLFTKLHLIKDSYKRS